MEIHITKEQKMDDIKHTDCQLIKFLTTPATYGYQSEVYETARSYGETRGGVVEIAFGITACPDFVRPNFQVKFGDNTTIAFRGDNRAKDIRVQSGYNHRNLSSGFNYNGNHFVMVKSSGLSSRQVCCAREHCTNQINPITTYIND